MTIEKRVYQKILTTFPMVPPEAGCALGAQEGIVTSFQYDLGTSGPDMAIYRPDIRLINQTIDEWETKGIQFCGLAHSHPCGQRTLSGGDVDYIHTIMEAMPAKVEKLCFPLVFPNEEMISFVAIRHQNKTEICADHIIFK